MNPKKLISRILTKIILQDGDFFRKKLLLTTVIYGPHERVYLGKGVNLQNALLNTNSGNIYVGDYTFCGHDCLILTGRHDYNMKDDARINNHPTDGGDINIGKGVWISSRAVILGGVTIADNSVIAAGAVVTKNCTRAAIYAGVPARVIKYLD